MKAQVCLGMYKADLQEQWLLLNLTMQRTVTHKIPRNEFMNIEGLHKYPKRTEPMMIMASSDIASAPNVTKGKELQDEIGISITNLVRRAVMGLVLDVGGAVGEGAVQRVPAATRCPGWLMRGVWEWVPCSMRLLPCTAQAG